MKNNKQCHSDRVAFKQREKDLQSNTTRLRFFIPSFLKKASFGMTIFLFFMVGCVAPPEYKDGLLENIPAIVDDTDYFSLSILGEDFSEQKDWDLLLITDTTDTILTTLILADLNISTADSSFLFMVNDSGDTIFRPVLLGDVVWSNEIAVSLVGSPKKISFIGDNFTGRLEFQILKK